MKLTVLLPLLFSTALASPIGDDDPTTTTITSNNHTLIAARGQGIVADADITIIFYQDVDCRGNFHNYNNLRYNINNQLVSGVLGNLYGGRSYFLSRDLRYDERLDFSRPGQAKGIPHNCAKYYKSAPVGQGKGCQPLGVKVSCFNIWRKPEQ